MAISLLADEDFDHDIIRGVLRRFANIDIVRVQEVGLSGQPDPLILEWAAKAGRVLLTHDVSTMLPYAYSRIVDDLPMPGVFAVSQSLPIAQAIEALIVLAECSYEGEWEGQVRHLPL